MSNIFTQKDARWKNIKLGFGNGTIGNYGCYLTALSQGLVDFGHDFTPRTFNNFLKEKQLWTGPYNNYIDVNRLPDELPDIFTSYKRINEWPGFESLEWYLSRDYIVLGKVSAKGIGGSGSHFVRIVDTKNSTMTIIQDPWYGTTDPVTKHYGSYGNILGLRVFGVKKYSKPMPDELQECLDQHTKLVDENIKLKEKLESEKKRCESLEKEAKKQKEAVEDLRSQLSGCKTRCGDLEGNHQNFVDKVAQAVGSIADESRILEAIEMNASELAKYTKKASDLKKACTQLEKKKEAEIMDLKESLKELKEANRKQAVHINRLEKRLKQLENDEPQFTFIQQLIRFLKGKK